MRRLTMVCCVMGVVGLCAASAAVAAPVYSFAFDQSSYVVAPGGTVNVKVFLRETPGSGTSVLDANGVGMFGAGVTLTNVAPLPANPSRVLATSDITPNNLFNDSASQQRAVTSTSVTLAEVAADLGTPVHADTSTVGLTDYYLTIGTFKFTAGATPGITHIQASRAYPAPQDTNVTNDFVALDGSIANASTTITVVPEPSTLVLGGISLLSLLAFRCIARRKR